LLDLYDESGFFKPRHWAWLIALGLLYAAVTLSQWSMAYLDFGDGNYMYIARRIAHGAVVYRDILAPQPPCHLFLGALIGKLADGCRVEPQNALYFFRAFSLLLHLGVFALVVALASRAWGRSAVAVLAGAIYLWLPIGFWWSMAYQSEPLEIFFLLFMMYLALRGALWSDLLAGVFAALAALTNATAWPFLGILILYMFCRAPLRALLMTLPFVLVTGLVVWALQAWTGGAFWQNIFGNQIGSYPSESAAAFFNYAHRKLFEQGMGVLMQEGAFVFLGLLGIWRYLLRSPLHPVQRGGLAWFCLTTLGSIIYVTKGGTEDYIFTLSEPAVAILGAGELMAWVGRWRSPLLPEPGSGWAPGGFTFPLAKAVALGLLAFFALGPGVNFYANLLTQSPASPIELSAERVPPLQFLIRKSSAPDEEVLAPPFYAFVAGRRIWHDYSEFFLWQMKYAHETAAHQPGEAVKMFQAMAKDLRNQKMPIVILEMDQTGKIPEVMEALLDQYQPFKVRPDHYLYPTHNTRLGIFIPRVGLGAEAQAEQRRHWQGFKADLAQLYGQNEVRQQFGAWYNRELNTPSR